MPHDLAISEHNDLIFAANNDLAMVFGTDLIEQRIRLRLKMIRGQWIYDEKKTLGSDLRSILHSPHAPLKTEAIVRAALADMKDIKIGNVDVLLSGEDGESGRQIVIRVNYVQVPSPGVIPGTQATTFQVEFPLTFQP